MEKMFIIQISDIIPCCKKNYEVKIQLSGILFPEFLVAISLTYLEAFFKTKDNWHAYICFFFYYNVIQAELF